MKITKFTLAALALACVSSLAVAAKKDPKPKKGSKAKTAYIFGFASSFNDSTVYMTGVQELDSAYFQGKAKFLVSRENYSYQFRDYLEQHGAGYRTCSVFFGTDKKKVEKKLAKMFNKYTAIPKAKRLKTGQKSEDTPTPYQVKQVGEADFHFQSIAPNEE